MIGCVQDGRALIKTAVEMKPDVILVDVGMPLLNGLEAGRELKKLSRCRTLLPATANDSDLRECLKSATALGIQALGLGLSELAVKTVETVGRSCSAMLKQGGVAKLVDNCRTISILPEVGLVALHENDGNVVTAIEKVVSSLFAEAKDLAGQQLDAFQNWRAPNKLILERLVVWANGESPHGLVGMRYQAWRPTFDRQEAQTYLQMWQGLLV